jgi:C4-dicarboxylate-specific signal transduction histidine kinase
VDEYIGVIMDITEQKRAEEELRRSEVNLRKVQSELAHVTRVTTMGELAASIAHEVNQPVAGVVLNGNACLRWLARLKEDSVYLVEAREALQRITGTELAKSSPGSEHSSKSQKRRKGRWISTRPFPR